MTIPVSQFGANIVILDLNLHTLDEIPGVLSQHLATRPDIVGISFTFDVSYKYTKEITAQVKAHNKETIVIMGGPAATVSYHDILDQQEHIDAVCYSEGETALCRLVDCENPIEELAKDPWIVMPAKKAPPPTGTSSLRIERGSRPSISKE